MYSNIKMRYRIFCYLLFGLMIIVMNISFACAKGISKEECKEACKEALSVIQPMNKENLEVHFKDMVNVVDATGKLCAISLGYEVDDTPYGYAIYDTIKNEIKEFVFCEGVGNMYEELEEVAEDNKNVDENKLMGSIVYEGGIDYCTFDEDGNKVELNEPILCDEDKNICETDSNSDEEIFETVSKSKYMNPNSSNMDIGMNMCTELNYWDVHDKNTSWSVVPDCGLAIISRKYIDETYRREYGCTCVAVTGIINWMG